MPLTEAQEREALELYERSMMAQVDSAVLRLIDVGMEAADRIKSDRVLSYVVDELTRKLHFAFHEWIESPDLKTGDMFRLHQEARAMKQALNEIFGLVDLAKRLDQELSETEQLTET